MTLIRCRRPIPLGALRPLLLIFASPLLDGCGIGSDHKSEIQPGEPAYPIENPKSRQAIEFRAFVPGELKVRFAHRFSFHTPLQRGGGLLDFLSPRDQ